MKAASGSARIIFIEKPGLRWRLPVSHERQIYLPITITAFADINAQLVSGPGDKARRIEHDLLLRIIGRITIINHVRQNISQRSIRREVVGRSPGRDQRAG